MNLPLHGVRETLLEAEPEEARRGLADALELASRSARESAEVSAVLKQTVARYPTFLEGWAQLADWALQDEDAVAAYAFARTGYHRGLDRIRKAGWGGQGPVPWHHEPNRGFLRSVRQLMLAAAAIGETPEALRCRDFLLELDPDDAQGVRAIGVE